jgi:hypothetical protein
LQWVVTIYTLMFSEMHGNSYCSTHYFRHEWTSPDVCGIQPLQVKTATGTPKTTRVPLGSTPGLADARYEGVPEV